MIVVGTGRLYRPGRQGKAGTACKYRTAIPTTYHAPRPPSGIDVGYAITLTEVPKKIMFE